MLVELLPCFQNVKIITFCLDLFKSKKFDVWFHFHGNRHTWKSRWWADCCGHSCREEKGTKSTLFLLPVPSPPQRSLLRFRESQKIEEKTSNKTKQAHAGWWEGVKVRLYSPAFLYSLSPVSPRKSRINPLRSGELQVHYLCYSK